MEWKEIARDTTKEEIQQEADSISEMIDGLAEIGQADEIQLASESQQELERILQDKKREIAKFLEKGTEEKEKGPELSGWESLPYKILLGPEIKERLEKHRINSSDIAAMIKRLPEIIEKDPELAYSIITKMYSLPSLSAERMKKLDDAMQSMMDKQKRLSSQPNGKPDKPNSHVGLDEDSKSGEKR